MRCTPETSPRTRDCAGSVFTTPVDNMWTSCCLVTLTELQSQMDTLPMITTFSLLACHVCFNLHRTQMGLYLKDNRVQQSVPSKLENIWRLHYVLWLYPGLWYCKNVFIHFSIVVSLSKWTLFIKPLCYCIYWNLPSEGTEVAIIIVLVVMIVSGWTNLPCAHTHAVLHSSRTWLDCM